MDLLSSGPEAPPGRLARLSVRARALGLAALVVAGAAVVGGPRVVADVRAAQAPPTVLATTSGGTVIRGRLRLWLLLEGPASARLTRVGADLPGSDVSTGTPPAAFSPQGFAVVRLDVTPRCPAALTGLGQSSLVVGVDDGRRRGPRRVVVPIDTSGLLAQTVQARCSGRTDEGPATGPRVRVADVEDVQGGVGPGVLRTVVDLGAPGPEVLVVESVTPGPGIAVEVVTTLPLRVPVGTRGRLVVDLRAGRCAPDPDSPPFVLEYAADGAIEPVVDAGLEGRLRALRSSGC